MQLQEFNVSLNNLEWKQYFLSFQMLLISKDTEKW